MSGQNPEPGTPEALDAQISALADEATNIVDSVDAEGRDFTSAEQDRIKAIFDQAAELRSANTKAVERVQLRDKIGGLVTPSQAKALNDAVAHGVPMPPEMKSLGERFVESNEFRGFMSQFPGGRIPDGAKGIHMPPFSVGGIKALITGGGTDGVKPLVPNQNFGFVPQPWGRRLVLRDLVTNGTTSSDTIEFARIKELDSLAGVVAEATDVTGTSGLKPQSNMTFEKVTAPVRTIAHWLAATKRALSDAGQLRTLIDGFLRYGLEYALEEEMLNGDGTGEHFTGLLNTPGTLAQAFDTDIFVTIRKAITTLEDTPTNYPPTAIVLNPIDAEALDLATNEGGDYLMGNAAIWSGAVPRTVWGLTRVVSKAMPAGTALVGAFNAAVLWDREQSTITATDSHADFFVRNLIAILAELRAAFGVLVPPAFCEVSLTPPVGP